MECHFNPKQEMRSSLESCKNNCLNEYFYGIKSTTKFLIDYNKMQNNLIIIYPLLKLEINFNYLPKMNLIDYLCSIGGLVSMWFGISLFNLTFNFVNITKIIIIRKIGLIMTKALLNIYL